MIVIHASSEKLAELLSLSSRKREGGFWRVTIVDRFIIRGGYRCTIPIEVTSLSKTAPIKSHSHSHQVSPARFVAAVERACKERGLRLTSLRKDVLKLVAAAGKPVKAYDLLEQLQDTHSNPAPPTVYRALVFLLDNGFIHKLESISAYVSCHHPAEAHQVPFLICDSCSSAQEICDERVAALIEKQAKDFGFRPQAQTLEVHGTCKNCI